MVGEIGLSAPSSAKPLIGLLFNVRQKGPPLHLRSGEAPYSGTIAGIPRHYLQCNSGARIVDPNGSPHRRRQRGPSAITLLPRIAVPAMLLCGGRNFSAWPAPHQATYPNAPPKWRRPFSPCWGTGAPIPLCAFELWQSAGEPLCPACNHQSARDSRAVGHPVE